MPGEVVPDELGPALADTLATGNDRPLRSLLIDNSGLPGPRLNLALVAAFARSVGAVVARPDPPVDALEVVLDGWAALSPAAAPGNRPEVILPCAAVAAYGEVGAARPEWWSDEMAKLLRAAPDARWRVRELVAQALQRMLDADWERTVAALARWASAEHALVVRAAVAGVAEPRLLGDRGRARDAAEIQRGGVGRYRAYGREQRHTDAGSALRQALGYTVSVTTAATGDFGLLEELAASADRDLHWIVRQNLGKARLQKWPERVEHLRRLL